MIFNPETDLEIKRTLSASPAKLWRCWSEPELFKQWFCPAPVTVTEAVLDLRAGGRFFTVMQMPDGSSFGNEGCFIEVIPARKITFTDALSQGLRPTGTGFMTATIEMTPEENHTIYTARILHADAAAKAKHEEMGFHDGWNTAIDQLNLLATGQSDPD